MHVTTPELTRLSLSHTHTHTLSHTNTHSLTHTLSLSVSLSLPTSLTHCRHDPEKRTLVFVDRQDAADTLFKQLLGKGYPCLTIHGGKVRLAPCPDPCARAAADAVRAGRGGLWAYAGPKRPRPDPGRL
jgi:hypothetical protein